MMKITCNLNFFGHLKAKVVFVLVTVSIDNLTRYSTFLDETQCHSFFFVHKYL